MITAIRGRTFASLSWLAGLVAALCATSAFAAQTDCVEDAPDGRFICKTPIPDPFSIGPCDEFAPFAARSAAWCRAGGGTSFNNVTGSCPGFTPHNEENVVARSVAFCEILHNGGGGTVTSDTGWNASYTTNFCVPSSGQVFNSGYLVADGRRLVVSCANSTTNFIETISIAKGRTLTCPLGFTARNVLRNGQNMTACTRPVKCPCDDVGNPVSAGTGIKSETETDYRTASGLSFTRHYDSNRFADPFTLTPDAHTVHQLGTTWRSNFDKRVIPLGVPSGVIALTFPDGQIQYFNNLGNEIINYSGARASLTTLPGGGFVYQGPDVVETYRADGRLLSITPRSGESLTLAYSDGVSGFFVDTAGNPTTEVRTANLLTRVTDAYGKALSFDYSNSGKLVVMTDPAGGRTVYGYDLLAIPENLASVTYPDGRVRQYRYFEPGSIQPPANVNFSSFWPHALTSIVDENGNVFATFKYDQALRAISTEHALGTQRYQFAYPTATTTTVTDPLGTSRTYTFATVDGLVRMTANPSPGGSGFGLGIQSQAYDTVGNLASKTDFNNNKTCYAYDTARNLETSRIEGLASTVSCTTVTPAGAALPSGSRRITTEWHPRWKMPARTAEARRITTYLYNGDAGASCAPAGAVIADGSANGQPIGVLCTKTVQSTTDASGSLGFGATLEGTPRTSTYTYDAHGHVLTANGPRTDVSDITATSYYADDDPDPGKRGNVASVTNALGHTTSITAYNGHGQPLTIVDPNGLTTSLSYDPRQRLKTRNVGGELTSYDYDFVGQLTKVTLPDGSFLIYSYDAAHRLTGMSDSLNNSISYTLDAMGNRKKEDVRDPANALAQTRSRVFDNLNRLFQEIGATGQTTQYAYDNQGNVTSIDGPLAPPLIDVTVNAYDALNRLRQVTDPNNGVTQYAYNGIDQLVSVTDPRNLATTYNYDGLSNLNSQQSPDTGTTTNTYDAAGNLRTQTDAKGQVTNYTYDALNRVAVIGFADGSVQAYGYDTGANGIGRLTTITELNPSQQITSTLTYAYDQHGRTASETRTVNGVAYVLTYAYDAFGRLSGMTYPSGRTIVYGFDTLGRISQVKTTPLGGAEQVVASDITYQPFGGVKSYTLGNGRNYVRSYDQDGRINSYTQGLHNFPINYDEASRITQINELDEQGNIVKQNTYNYDLLDRLMGAQQPGVPYAYTYDAVGNRKTRTVGSSTDTYTYNATSNQIANITVQAGAQRNFVFDPNGSTTADGVNLYGYDARGRMVQATGALGATTYQVNALGQRIRKTSASDDRVFLYDTRGRLIAETDPGGGLKREYLYLNDIPLAVIQ